MTLLTDEVKAWIGREVVYVAPEELGRASIRAFAVAIGDDNSLYTDDAFAREHGYPSVIAPPTLVCETNQLTPLPPDSDGYAGHRFDLPIEGCRLIRGGNEYELTRPVYPSDVITTRWVVKDISERVATNGARMLFVVSEATYTNQDGEHLATNRETIIYQEVLP